MYLLRTNQKVRKYKNLEVEIGKIRSFKIITTHVVIDAPRMIAT